jgi:lipid II isoglutaminyl synthase (glutamine-hydrolysing)
MSDKIIKITHLYPNELSIYGDIGNVLCLKFELKKYGYDVDYQTLELGEGSQLPTNTDFYFIGGGQDKEQEIVFADLNIKQSKLIADLENNIPLLAICGGYQLLGTNFLTGSGQQIGGLGVFPVTTVAPQSDSVKSRCTGNLIIDCNIPEINWTKLVGFENHSGQTTFVNSNKTAIALGATKYGFGNTSIGDVEGCVYKNCVGTYLHGCCLSKNIELTLWFILKIMQNIGDSDTVSKITEKLSDMKVEDRTEHENSISASAKNNILNRFA